MQMQKNLFVLLACSALVSLPLLRALAKAVSPGMHAARPWAPLPVPPPAPVPPRVPVALSPRAVTVR